MADMIDRDAAIALFAADENLPTQIIRDKLNTLPAAQVTVKQLEWFEGDEPDEWKSGPYDVWCELGKYQVYYWSIVMGEPHETAKAAKAAAQADYEARIRSALTVTPHDPAKVQALVETVQYLRDAMRDSITHTDEPHTVVLPDGSRHSGPVVDFLHTLVGAQIRVLDAALAAMKEG